MSLHCTEINKEISEIITNNELSDFTKCEKIRILINEPFGNDFITKYPAEHKILETHFTEIFENKTTINFMTKKFLDRFVCRNKISEIKAEILNEWFKDIPNNDFKKLKKVVRELILNKMITHIKQIYQVNTAEFIKNAQKIHPNLWNYEQTLYIDDETELTVLCQKCKKCFRQLPKKHLHANTKCFKCFVNNNFTPLKSGKDEKSYNWSKILDGLYLGNIEAAFDEIMLNNCKIKSVIDLTNGSNMPRPIIKFRIKPLKINVEDTVSANISPHLNRCFKFIDENKTGNKSVMVYCRQGVSRSASVIIGYLMQKCNASLKEVITYVKKRRAKAQPNRGFMEQLRTFEQKQSIQN